MHELETIKKYKEFGKGETSSLMSKTYIPNYQLDKVMGLTRSGTEVGHKARTPLRGGLPSSMLKRQSLPNNAPE